MRRIALVLVFTAGLIAPAFAQKTEIEAVNAKWVDFFNKGDFVGIASLYTEDAAAFPPGAGIVRGKDAIGAMWKGLAEQVSDPKVTTLEVKALGPSAAREIGTVSLRTRARPRRKSPASMWSSGKKSETIGNSRPISGTTASRNTLSVTPAPQRCPLLALSGHPSLRRTCPLSGKADMTFAARMSAFDPSGH